MISQRYDNLSLSETGPDHHLNRVTHAPFMSWRWIIDVIRYGL